MVTSMLCSCRSRRTFFVALVFMIMPSSMMIWILPFLSGSNTDYRKHEVMGEISSSEEIWDGNGSHK